MITQSWARAKSLSCQPGQPALSESLAGSSEEAVSACRSEQSKIKNIDGLGCLTQILSCSARCRTTANQGQSPGRVTGTSLTQLSPWHCAC